MILEMERNGFGLNEVNYHWNNTATKKTATLYGRGWIDQIALAALRLLGNFISDLKPIKFSVSYNELEKCHFPKELYITKKALKTLLSLHFDVWSSKEGHPTLTKLTKNKILNEALAAGDEIVFNLATDFTRYRIDAEISQRISQVELCIADQLKNATALPYKITLPITDDPVKTESAKTRPLQIKIEEVANGKREAKLVSTKDANFTDEAKYVIQSVLAKVNEIAEKTQLPQQMSKKLEKAVFIQQFHDLNNDNIEGPYDLSKGSLDCGRNGDISDLLYASKIDINGGQYIASSYPNWFTSHPFWAMVYEQKSPLIIKLDESVKAYKADATYWPSFDETYEYEGGLTVTTVEEQKVWNFLTKRKIEITKGDQVHTVTQLDFTGWPDMAVPNQKDFMWLLDMAYLAQSNAMSQNELSGQKIGPMIVHCNGGNGRTGTFIAIFSTYLGSNPDFKQVVYSLRKQYSKLMVATLDQWKFIKKIHDYFHNTIE